MFSLRSRFSFTGMTCFQDRFQAALFLPIECVTVHIEISALRRERCQTEQHGLRVVISNGEL